jgi:hypothetical protein
MTKKKRNVGGRPTVFTPEVVAKLEQAFAIDATVEEACSYASISRDAFYDYLKREPKFSDRITDLRQRPVLAARQTIVTAVKTQPESAKWYLERKRKAEFAQRNEHTGPDGVPLVVQFANSFDASTSQETGTGN